MSNIKPEDIIEFVKNWRSSDEILTEEQITNFVAELQEQVSSMDFSKTYGKTIIGYSGWSNNSKCFEIVDVVCKSSDSNAIYISSLPAGELLGEPYRSKLEEAIFDIVENKETVDMIMGGWKNNERVGPLCGYGDYLSIDDFVSAKLMGESYGDSNNIIIFVPEEINSKKVFASTEIHKIFSNDTYEFINGIPKSDIMVMDEAERFVNIKSIAKNDFANSEVYLNDKGRIIGRSLSDTLLGDCVRDYTPPEPAYKMNSLRHTTLLNDARLSNANISEFYGASVDGLSGLDLIKAKDFMSDVLEISEMKEIKSIESLTQKADDVLSIIGKDSIEYKSYTFTKGTQIAETLEDGTKVIIEPTDMVTAADAEKAGLPHCTIHGFRHSVASILDDNGVPIQDISVLLGHESVNTTERIYINRRKTAKETTINTLDSAINLNIA